LLCEGSVQEQLLIIQSQLSRIAISIGDGIPRFGCNKCGALKAFKCFAGLGTKERRSLSERFLGANTRGKDASERFVVVEADIERGRRR
jgi:hypothetical protein